MEIYFKRFYVYTYRLKQIDRHSIKEKQVRVRQLIAKLSPTDIQRKLSYNICPLFREIYTKHITTFRTDRHTDGRTNGYLVFSLINN